MTAADYTGTVRSQFYQSIPQRVAIYHYPEDQTDVEAVSVALEHTSPYDGTRWAVVDLTPAEAVVVALHLLSAVDPEMLAGLVEPEPVILHTLS